ncbi:hypothetical protein CGMCC3_g5823 [Colletotrichum fructicola]|nr:uncharacterized protein CGMCC3_g5823 [Colletotrichum fructicola]KAE9578213.1 hypothetical protein CGMCC3_g5823 [Colletotrichum fructicola]
MRRLEDCLAPRHVVLSCVVGGLAVTSPRS